MEKIEDEEIKRYERREKGRRKKEEILEKIRREKSDGRMEGKPVEWVRRKQRHWREYREREGISMEDEEDIRRELIKNIPKRKLKGNLMDGGKDLESLKVDCEK